MRMDAVSGQCCRRVISLVVFSGIAWLSGDRGSSLGHAAEWPAASIQVQPDRLIFDRPESSEQLLITLLSEGGRRQGDATRSVRYETAPPGVVHISAEGLVTPIQDGQALITIRKDQLLAKVAVEVRGIRQPPPISFHRDITPILTKASCNAGGCHGKAEGQNGFKLSVFGYDPVFDHQALVMESAGRRVNVATPAQSLVLRKGLAEIPHGGGRKLEPGSVWHRRLERWIREGARFDRDTSGSPTTIAVIPAEVELKALESQQVRVVAVGSDGFPRCVTSEAEFQSNNEVVAGVDRNGIVTAAEAPGEAAILVRYLGHVAICRITRPRSDGEFVRPPENNLFDHHAWNKLEKLKIPASPLSSDAEFLRRVFLDVIGTLPTAKEAEAFLNDRSPTKRQQVIAMLLQRPEYNDYWTQRWADLLQVDKDILTPQGAVAITRWIHDQLERNIPFDEFAKAVVTARGSISQESPAAFYRVQKDAERASRAISQLFLGVRIECAQCHHHPFEKWDQEDYFAMAGFYTSFDVKPSPFGGHKVGIKPGIDLKHPRTGEPVSAAAYETAPANFDGVYDRREVLAEWLASPKNEYFKRTIVNRLWAHYFGRGLVEPVDDLRATNPASNEPLMTALTDELVRVKFDLRELTRKLLESRAYQLSSRTLTGNELDEQNYSHAIWKPIPAEVLLDAISQVTEVPEHFNGWPVGYRSIQVWDNKLPSDFLRIFGRPSRLTVCACERGVEPSMAQALHLMNSETTTNKLQHREGRTRRLADSDASPEKIIRELYLATFSRFPSAEEQLLMQRVFRESGQRQAAVEDILWTLMNSKEFLFNH